MVVIAGAGQGMKGTRKVRLVAEVGKEIGQGKETLEKGKYQRRRERKSLKERQYWDVLVAAVHEGEDQRYLLLRHLRTTQIRILKILGLMTQILRIGPTICIMIFFPPFLILI